MKLQVYIMIILINIFSCAYWRTGGGKTESGKSLPQKEHYIGPGNGGVGYVANTIIRNIKGSFELNYKNKMPIGNLRNYILKIMQNSFEYGSSSLDSKGNFSISSEIGTGNFELVLFNEKGIKVCSHAIEIKDKITENLKYYCEI